MSQRYYHALTAVAVVGLLSSASLGLLYGFDHDNSTAAAAVPSAVPPAEDAITQSLDLDRIARFRYVNDRQVQLTDDFGHKFAMRFTAPCPQFKKARDFSMVTEGYQNLDRFTAVRVGGHICTFKNFALEH
jgi:hypothetical protein